MHYMLNDNVCDNHSYAPVHVSDAVVRHDTSALEARLACILSGDSIEYRWQHL